MILFFSFLFGLIIGSFLNSVIYRIKTKEGVVFAPTSKILTRGLSRSHCPFCNKTLKWFELIPLLSFILQKGRCRFCGAKISWQYPLVELATGLIFAFIFYKFPIFSIQNNFSIDYFLFAIFYLLIISIFIIIFVYDYLYYEIPNGPLFLGIIVALLFNFYKFGFKNLINFNGLLNPLFASFVASGFFYLIWLISKGKWLGFGDVKLAILLGLVLGWPQILLALFLAFGIGAILGIILVVLKYKNLKSQIPFGPFLILGAFMTLFWYQEIINWYLRLLNFF